MFLAQVDAPRSLSADPYRVHAYARPHGGRALGGDRLAATVTPAGLAFLVADAAGHGPRGQAFWERWEPAVLAEWQTFCASACGTSELEHLARGLNDELYAGGAHLALAVGVLGVGGRLRHAVCGYGVHVLPAELDGAPLARTAPPPFGFKLGWFSTAEWAGSPRAFVAQEVGEVRQVVVLTDGFLGEDHRDPERTLRDVEALGERCARLDPPTALEHVRALPHADDDASVLVLSPPGAT